MGNVAFFGTDELEKYPWLDKQRSAHHRMKLLRIHTNLRRHQEGQGLRTKTLENRTGDIGAEGGVQCATLAFAARGAFQWAAFEHFG